MTAGMNEVQPYFRFPPLGAAACGHRTTRATSAATPAYRQCSDERAAVPAIHAGLDPGADPQSSAPFAHFQVPSQKFHN
ncbi:MAG: hypothetical protein INR71_11675 [Terriglobus roseus]|nr:hypothetical protein [Terriglobus roseus]